MPFDTSLNNLDIHSRSKDHSYSVAKWHEVAETFAMADSVREMTAKGPSKSKEYGPFEHLLFLVCPFIS